MRTLIVAGTGLVVVVVAVLGIRAYLDYREGQAAVALGKAFVEYSTYLSGKDDQKTADAAIGGLEKVAVDYGLHPGWASGPFGLGRGF